MPGRITIDAFTVTVESFGQSLLALAPDVLTGLVLLLVVWFGAKIVHQIVIRSARRMRGDDIVWGYLANMIRILLLAIGWVTAVQIMHVPVETLLATLGISGLIIGLGARQSIANFFLAMLMLTAQPFKLGDLIEFGPPPQIGRVTGD